MRLLEEVPCCIPQGDPCTHSGRQFLCGEPVAPKHIIITVRPKAGKGRRKDVTHWCRKAYRKSSGWRHGQGWNIPLVDDRYKVIAGVWSEFGWSETYKSCSQNRENTTSETRQLCRPRSRNRSVRRYRCDNAGRYGSQPISRYGSCGSFSSVQPFAVPKDHPLPKQGRYRPISSSHPPPAQARESS